METQENETITDVAQLVALMEYALENNQPVIIQFPEEPQRYFTALASRPDEALVALRQGEYVPINLMGPPKGNEKIRTAPEMQVQVSFYTDQYQVVFSVPFLGDLDERRLKLAFPTQALLYPQNREAPRFKATKKFDGRLTVVPEEGHGFPVKIQDISRGGISFYSDDPDLPVRDFSTVRLKSHVPPLADMTFQVRVIGNKTTRKGHHCHRAYFQTDTQEERDNLHRLVDHLMIHAKTVQETAE